MLKENRSIKSSVFYLDDWYARIDCFGSHWFKWLMHVCVCVRISVCLFACLLWFIVKCIWQCFDLFSSQMSTASIKQRDLVFCSDCCVWWAQISTLAHMTKKPIAHSDILYHPSTSIFSIVMFYRWVHISSRLVAPPTHMMAQIQCQLVTAIVCILW